MIEQWSRLGHGLGAAILAGGLGLLSGGPAIAQESAASYPKRPVRMIVPYVPGGAPDVMARVVAVRLNESMGQQFLVDNRPGGGGVIGADLVAKSAPDGYTVLVGDAGPMTITPIISTKVPYDPAKDFIPVSLLGASTFFLVVSSSTGASTFGEFAAQAKSAAGGLNYGSTGMGSLHHLIMEAMLAQTSLKLVHVPYKGSGQAVPAIIAGQVSTMITALPAIAAHVKAGTVKSLAVARPKRSEFAPEVPTFEELGVPGMDFPGLIGVFAPAGTPAAIVAKLSAELGKAIRHPAIVERFYVLGIEPSGNSPEAYAAQFHSEREKFGKVINAIGLKAD